MKHTKTLAVSALVLGTVITSSVFAFDYAKTATSLNPFASSAVTKVLQDKGLTAPTTDETKAYMEKMVAAREAEQKLSDADKAGLKTLRESFQKQERDYLRTKGIALPTEAEITKMNQVREALRSQAGEFQGALQSMGMGRGEGMGAGRGMMGNEDGAGMGRGGKGFGKRGANSASGSTVGTETPAATQASN